MGPQKKRRRSSNDAKDDEKRELALEVPPVAKPPLDDDGPAQKSPRKSADCKSQQASRQLFVRSLPASVTQESLTELFSQSYPLRHAVLVCDPSTGKSKGYGFVTFADTDDAQRAREEFNGFTFEGQKIKVEFAEHRHREGGSGKASKGIQTTSPPNDGPRPGRQKPPPEPPQPSKLIVRNLPWSIKEPEQLALLFRSYGKVKHAVVPKRKPGVLAGFGFVMMRGRKNAERAMEAVNGKEVDGRTIAVDWAVEKRLWDELHSGQPPTAEKDDEGTEGDELDDAADAEDDLDDEEAGSEVMDHVSDALSVDGSDTGSLADSDEENRPPTHPPSRAEKESATIFVRNVPFSASDDTLYQHFIRFGPVRYARIVVDSTTERPKGTAFVCFYRQTDADACLREAPRPREITSSATNSKNSKAALLLGKHSVLQNEMADPTGRYTFDGRVLQLCRAVDKNEAAKLTEAGSSFRDRRDRDKRRLYLLSEGTLSPGTPFYNMLPPSEIQAREASTKQRKALIQSNPSLHLSLTRLSIRNIPRTVTSKELKALARQAVVEFAKDVKAKKRQPLSKEEVDRGGDEMKEAEKARKAKGKGIVKQAKIVFEGREGGKVAEESGAGRSRGYGFIEYTSHRWALMGLRWLNGHAISYNSQAEEGKKKTKSETLVKKKRLIVEFAIENAQVVMRRKEREVKMREKARTLAERQARGQFPDASGHDTVRTPHSSRLKKGTKRKREANDERPSVTGPSTIDPKAPPNVQTTDRETLVKRQRIIAKKRMQRRSRKKGLKV